jgi:hypothetical protein
MVVEHAPPAPPGAKAPSTHRDPHRSTRAPGMRSLASLQARAAGHPANPAQPPTGELTRLHELAASAHEGRRLWMGFARHAHAAGDTVGLRTYLARAWALSRAVRRHKRQARQLAPHLVCALPILAGDGRQTPQTPQTPRQRAASIARRRARAPRLATRLILKAGPAYAVLEALRPRLRQLERAPAGSRDAARLTVWRRVWLEVWHQGQGEVRP